VGTASSKSGIGTRAKAGTKARVELTPTTGTEHARACRRKFGLRFQPKQATPAAPVREEPKPEVVHSGGSDDILAQLQAKNVKRRTNAWDAPSDTPVIVDRNAEGGSFSLSKIVDEIIEGKKTTTTTASNEPFKGLQVDSNLDMKFDFSKFTNRSRTGFSLFFFFFFVI
jgi:hypothetical protein